MYKKIMATLLIFMLAFNTSYAAPVDVINNILNRKVANNTTTPNSIINDILNNKQESIEVEIIKDKENIEEVKKNVHEGKERMVGVDISKWNGNIDWASLKDAGIEFVIIRAGYGTGTVDRRFKENIENAIDNGMLIGIYWFSYACNTQQAKAEADKCYKTIRPYKDSITLPVFWDFEYDSVERANRKGKTITKEQASNMADTFCTTIKSKGFHTGIYSNIDYSKRYFTEEILSKYHTWIAQWRSSCTYKNDYIIWQCSDNYIFKGKRFDLDYLYYNKYIQQIKSCFTKPRKKMTVKATAYYTGSITSTGTKPKWGVIAVDPKVIPYGSIVYIPEFNKFFVAEDCGGAIKGNRIDIFMISRSDCVNWGIREIEIEIVQ